VARVLLVGCGCRARGVAHALREEGYSVRGTTRDPASLAAIEEAGAEAVIADPDRLGTVVPLLEGVSVVCWLLASAAGDPDDLASLHGPRLLSLLESLVDSAVRGFVYEAAGSAPAALLIEGAEIVRVAAERHRMPVEIVAADPDDQGVWERAVADAVGRLLHG
jgi:nucleoside-diphosphate-sugar epimerase